MYNDNSSSFQGFLDNDNYVRIETYKFLQGLFSLILNEAFAEQDCRVIIVIEQIVAEHLL